MDALNYLAADPRADIGRGHRSHSKKEIPVIVHRRILRKPKIFNGMKSKLSILEEIDEYGGSPLWSEKSNNFCTPSSNRLRNRIRNSNDSSLILNFLLKDGKETLYVQYVYIYMGLPSIEIGLLTQKMLS